MTATGTDRHMSRTAREFAEQYRWEGISKDFERIYELARAPDVSPVPMVKASADYPAVFREL